MYIVSTQGTSTLENPFNPPDTLETAAKFFLGGEPYRNFYFRGIMADMRTHNTALSQAEIEQLYADTLRV